MISWTAFAMIALTFWGPAHPSPQALQKKPAVEKLGDGLFRIGDIKIDTKKGEVSVPGTVNSATTLEWVANTRDGAKAYESAFTLATDGVTFNTALLLIGMDVKHSRVPTQHFDAVPPKGDPLELWVDWMATDGPKHMRIENLLFDQRTNAPLANSAWVYTGSSFAPEGQYRADFEGGVLIGFVHSPAPVIENAGDGAVGAFGAVIFNTRVGLAPGTAMTLTVKALKQAGQ